MAESSSTRIDPAAVSTADIPHEQLEVEEPSTEAELVYPTGAKLAITIGVVMVVSFFKGLDIAIVAVVVPSLTNEFKTLEDIGWYSAAYGIFFAAFNFFFGKMYTVFSVKRTFLTSLAVFEVGSLICTVAPRSATFVFGRAVAGIGSCGMQTGGLLMVSQSFPNDKRPIWLTITGSSQAIGLVSAPVVGGALADALSWRACFGMSLPFGVAIIAAAGWAFKEQDVSPDRALPWKEKLNRLDLGSTTIVIPSITCLLMALQWGGLRYGWDNWRIILLLVMFAVLFLCFCYLQYRLDERATLPLRILKNRSILACAWFAACCNGTLAVTEYYIAIYFQGVRGYSASKAGSMILPMLIGITVSGIAAGIATSKIGYYSPFALATTLLAPIASGLLTTIDMDESLIKILCCLGFLGVAIGFGIQVPGFAVNTVLPLRDMSIGISIVGFGAALGSSFFVVASAALFQHRLAAEVSKSSPEVNITEIGRAGLSEIRNVVGSDRLGSVLLGYDEAVVQTLYIPVALTTATILGTSLIEWKSVKQKQT